MFKCFVDGGIIKQRDVATSCFGYANGEWDRSLGAYGTLTQTHRTHARTSVARVPLESSRVDSHLKPRVLHQQQLRLRPKVTLVDHLRLRHLRPRFESRSLRDFDFINWVTQSSR